MNKEVFASTHRDVSNNGVAFSSIKVRLAYSEKHVDLGIIAYLLILPMYLSLIVHWPPDEPGRG
jgi:hypothetical protein